MTKCKNNVGLMNDVLNRLEECKLTVESLVFSEDAVPTPEPELPPVEDETEFISKEELGVDVPNEGNKNIQDKINQIRQLCLQAITELANDPTSQEYDLMKRIWNLVDKTIENKKEDKPQA